MIKKIVFAVASLASLGSATKFLSNLGEKVPPPTDGKFFYTDMRSGG